MEELQARHRKEQRDLQSRITQKKKQANKKSRKGVNDECTTLEEELRLKQQMEIAELNGESVEDENTDELSEQKLGELMLENNQTAASNMVTNGTTDHHGDEVTDGDANAPPTSSGKKRNRAKDRLARRAAEQEELARQAAEEAQNMPDKKQLERQHMLESMKQRGLKEREIRADGHCLYSAVADQLENLDISIGSAPSDNPAVPYKIIRGAAADYIENHQDDFVPFLEEPLDGYLHKVRDTGEWGGQLELMALAKTYGIDIHVLQDFDRVEKIESGNNQNDRIMWLAYYKHGFGLGEHYNSLRKAP